MLYEILTEITGKPGRREGRCWKFFSPFREERTPSFAVYQDDTWYDFGIGEGGDLPSFFMKLFNCSYPEALAEIEAYKIKGYSTSMTSKKIAPAYNLKLKPPLATFFGLPVPASAGAFRIIYRESEYFAFPCPEKRSVQGLECRKLRGEGPEKLSLFRKTFWFLRRSLRMFLVAESIRDCLAATTLGLVPEVFSLVSLNGVGNWKKAAMFVARHQPVRVALALDNDFPGENTHEKMKRFLQSHSIKVEDWSFHYRESGVKDFFRLYERRKNTKVKDNLTGGNHENFLFTDKHIPILRDQV